MYQHLCFDMEIDAVQTCLFPAQICDEISRQQTNIPGILSRSETALHGTSKIYPYLTTTKYNSRDK